MNIIPVFSVDLYNSTITHTKNINIYNILQYNIKSSVIMEIIHWHRAKSRKLVAHALSKGLVNATGKKPFAQKGRGFARQGSLKNPHQRGGGVAFPPGNNVYKYKINKKKKIYSLTIYNCDKIERK